MKALKGRLYLVLWEIFLLNAYSQASDSYYTVKGQFYELKCDVHAADNGTLIWNRNHDHTIQSQHITMTNNSLWFLPVFPSDSGNYTCSNGASLSKMILHVENGLCPSKSDMKRFQNGTTQKLYCGKNVAFTLDKKAKVNWLKDCVPLHVHDKNIIIPNVTGRNAGKYTCQIYFMHNKKNYTASRTVQLQIKDEPVFLKPRVISPREETVSVEPGFKAKLECKVFLGISDNAKEEALVYWTLNNTFVEDHKQMYQILTFEKRENIFLHGRSILSIDTVEQEHFHVPFHCIVSNPVGQDVGLVRLTPACHRGFYTHIVICLTPFLIIIFLVIYFVFKVDMVLAFRRLKEAFGIQRKSDGKLYDAYVSYLQGNTLCSSQVNSFVMNILPEVLEGLYGYKLFIRGRDDVPGEAVYDIIADTVRKSRRMIIILSAQSPVDWDTKELLNQEQSEFEQEIGLYDALIQDTLQVILLEMDKNIGYSHLPESVKYVKQKQGALRWRPSKGDPTSSPNRCFWKVLRYRMSEIKSVSSIP